MNSKCFFDRRISRICVLFAMCVGATACGGGGSGSNSPPPPPPPPLPPSDGTVVYKESVDDGIERLYMSPTPVANEQEIVIGAISVPPSYSVSPDNLNLRSASQIGLIRDAIWSLDGQRLAINIVREDINFGADNAQIFVMDRDGSNAELASPQLLGTSTPVWSPDGKLLLFAMAKGPMFTDYGLFVSDLDAETTTEIALPANWQPFGPYVLQWSADMQSLYFSIIDDVANQSAVYQVDRATGTVMTLIPVVPGRIRSLSTDSEFALVEKTDSSTSMRELVRTDLLTFDEIKIDQSVDRLGGKFLSNENRILASESKSFLMTSKSLAEISGNTVTLTPLLDLGSDFLDFTEF